MSAPFDIGLAEAYAEPLCKARRRRSRFLLATKTAVAFVEGAGDLARVEGLKIEEIEGVTTAFTPESVDARKTKNRYPAMC